MRRFPVEGASEDSVGVSLQAEALRTRTARTMRGRRCRFMRTSVDRICYEKHRRNERAWTT
jgi:hypothetical protein